MNTQVTEQIIDEGATEATEQACVTNHEPQDTQEHHVDDAAVTAVEVRFTRGVLESVTERRKNSPPKRSERESEQDYEVRKAWWKRGQQVLVQSEDVADDELIHRFAKGIIAHLNYNEANNILRAVMAGMTYQFRRIEQGVVAKEAEALSKAKQLSGDSAVDSTMAELFGDNDDGREAYPNQDEYFASLTSEVARYIIEQFHALFSRVLGRMYQRDSDSSRKNNTPRPFDFESLPFTSVNLDGVFIPQLSLDDAMRAIDNVESERAANAIAVINDAPEIHL